MKPVGIDTSGSSPAPPLDGQLGALLDALGEADELDDVELGEADELNEGEFEDWFEATVVGPHAVAPTIASAATLASSFPMPDFIRTS
jgi:hypothetical protein